MGNSSRGDTEVYAQFFLLSAFTLHRQCRQTYSFIYSLLHDIGSIQCRVLVSNILSRQQNLMHRHKELFAYWFFFLSKPQEQNCNKVWPSGHQNSTTKNMLQLCRIQASFSLLLHESWLPLFSVFLLALRVRAYLDRWKHCAFEVRKIGAVLLGAFKYSSTHTDCEK